MGGILVFAALALCPALLFSQEVSFELHPSTTSPQLGEPFTIEAEVRSSAAQSVVLDAAASSTDSYRVTAISAQETKTEGTSKVQRFSVEVIALAVGKIPIVLSWKAPEVQSAIQSPPVIVVATEPPLEPEPQLLDIKEPRAARAALWPWLLAAALIALAYAAYRRFSRKPGEAAAAELQRDERPPDVRAQQALAQLEASGLWQEHRHKDFYVQLTDILRQYLDGRFGLGAAHSTTYELSRQMRRAEIDRQAAAAVKEIFDRADLVKFAKTKPDEESGPRDIGLAREAVRQTSPQDAALAAPATP